MHFTRCKVLCKILKFSHATIKQINTQKQWIFIRYFQAQTKYFIIITWHRKVDTIFEFCFIHDLALLGWLKEHKTNRVIVYTSRQCPRSNIYVPKLSTYKNLIWGTLYIYDQRQINRRSKGPWRLYREKKVRFDLPLRNVKTEVFTINNIERAQCPFHT